LKIVYGKDGKCLAQVLRLVDYHPQTEKKFFSDPEDTLQIGSLFFPATSFVAAHKHPPKDIPRKPMEVILVLAGDARCNIYDKDGLHMETVKLQTGDILIQKNGGHEFHFVSNTTLLEVKCGPYLGEKDKEPIKL
jgi:hypothetical protein